MHSYSPRHVHASVGPRTWAAAETEPVATRRNDEIGLEPYPAPLVITFVLLSCATLWAGIFRLAAHLI